MTAKRNWVAGVLFTGGALLAAGAGISIAIAADAADDAATAPAAAPGAHWRHHGRGPWRMYGKLGLTDDQKAAIKAIMAVDKPQLETLHEQMQANRLKLLQTNPGEPNFASVVAEVAQSNASLMTQRATREAELQTQIYTTVLTAAQKTQLAAQQQAWAAKIAAHQAGS
jgi:Spy/CpxP family protein refolding chaperone